MSLPIISLKKLRHIAGGLAGSFVRRNNDVGGQWALGLLYRDAPQDQRVQLNLLEHTTIPSTNIARQVARNYGEFLRRAAIKKDVPLEELAEAKVELSFDADLHIPGEGWVVVGDVFLCTVTLTLKDSRIASTQRMGRCLRYEKGQFGGRKPGNDSIIESLRSGF
ncbi:hypothetical protein NHH88_28680 [Oxalobacteraceae bacterium OTU3CAMAD1]|nr:hypothetical protein NHH88_28680 [Oxalobacteraceae bacterium OTU3CAMAD1]